MTLQEKFERLARDKFLGIPVKDFEAGGREQLGYLQRAGLRSNSKLVDIGCGVLRAGYWIVGFLDANSYCGIEPHRERLEIGIHNILDPGTVERKRPRFDSNSEFDTSVFFDKFDFFLAYSIWTHAAKPQIQTMLDAFLRDSTDKGKFLTTYLPANWIRRDYRGDQWYGTSHESNVPGCIGHSFKWIKAECELRGLTVSKLTRDETHRQSWLLIEKKLA
jgi:hypothetical protein